MKKTINKILIGAASAIIGFSALGAQNFVSDAGSVDYLNTGAAILSGTIVDLGDRYGIAMADIASNATGTVKTDGKFKLLRAVTNAIANGTSLYRASATGVTDVASADTYIGQSVGAVAVTTHTTNQFIVVDINAPQRQIANSFAGATTNINVAGIGVTNQFIWTNGVLWLHKLNP